jgi:hypothetical protein
VAAHRLRHGGNFVALGEVRRVPLRVVSGRREHGEDRWLRVHRGGQERVDVPGVGVGLRPGKALNDGLHDRGEQREPRRGADVQRTVEVASCHERELLVRGPLPGGEPGLVAGAECETHTCFLDPGVIGGGIRNGQRVLGRSIVFLGRGAEEHTDVGGEHAPSLSAR